MAVSLTHTTVAVGTNAGNGEIAKEQWNENHTLTMAADRILGRTTAGAGAVEEIAAGTGLTLSAGTLSVAANTYQPLDSELTALSGLASAADTAPYFTGAGTAALMTVTAAGRNLLDDIDAAAQRTTLGLAIGSDVQAYDAELAAIAGLVSAADRLPYFTGAGTASLATFTAAGRNLLDDADAAAQRTTLGLGTADSPQFTAIELGAATDTTISRVSAGVVAVEGKNVALNGTTETLTTGTIELGAAADTTISRSSAGVIAVEGVTVPLNSVTSIHTAQQIELGHASDTTITRVSAGVAAIEGKNIALNGTGETLTTGSIELGAASDTTITRSAAGVIAVEGGVIPKENRTNTFSAAQVIEVTDNTNAALRVTQLGTAPAIRVEDETNPDASPFVVDASGNVGIGTDAPSTKLDVVTVGGGGASIFNRGEGVTQNAAIRHSTDATAPVMLLRKVRGTIASPTAVATSDAMGVLRFQAYGGTNNRTLAEIQGVVEAYTSDTNISSYLSFLTSAAGGVTAAEKMRIDGSGNVLVTSTGGLGYGTGSGAAQTQGTSRTTGVTINATNGAITMFSAGGSTTAATFTVTNNKVADTDTIILCQNGGTNLYRLHVTDVAAGSFNITFQSTGGTANDAPVINFAVIKAVTS